MGKNNVFGTGRPSKKSFDKARKFVSEHPDASQRALLHHFANCYGNEVNIIKFSALLVHLFDAIEE